MKRRTALKSIALGFGGLVSLPTLANPFTIKKGNGLKLGFSSLGCPEWTWTNILTQAKQMGYDGFELRGLGKEIDLLNCAEFSAGQINTSLQQVKDAGLKIINLGSSANLHTHEPEKRKEQLDQAKKYIDLAHALESPFIRVFPNNIPKEYPKQDTLDKISSGLNELGDYAKGSGVKVLLETHGDLVWTEDIASVMKNVTSPNAGLIWDFFNMYIVTRQSPQVMYDHLKPYIHHVHLKDAKIETDGKFRYVFPGLGDSPLKEAITILKKNKYKGFYTFEWEKRWHNEIESPEQAFPTFIEFIKKMQI